MPAGTKLPSATITSRGEPESARDVRSLLRYTFWALRLIWFTNRSIAVGLGAVTLVRGLLPVGLALVGRGLIDAFVAGARTGGAGMERVLPWLIAGFVLTLFEAVTPLANRFMISRLRDDLNLEVTSRILTHAARLDVAFFEDFRTREIIERAQQNTGERVAAFVSDAQMGVTNAVQAVSLVALLITIEPLVLVVAPLALPYLMYQWRISSQRFTLEHARTAKRRWTNYFVSRLTSQGAVAETKLLALGPLLIDRFRKLMREFRDQDRRLYRRGLAGSFLFALLTTVAFYLMFARVVMRALNGLLTVGDIAIFGAATSRLRSTVDGAISFSSSAMEQTLFVSNLIRFLAVEPRIPQEAPAHRSGARLPARARGEIEFRNVTFTYPGAAAPTLVDVSFHVEPGEVLALVGENGAGKSTIVKLIARLYDPDAGSVEFDGVDLRELSIPDLHRRLSFVLQGAGRYEATAAENIAYGDWRATLDDREKIKEIAQMAGVDDMIRALPQGYDTMLGRLFGDYDLSGGQWQKLAVARAFAKDSEVMILDEPTSSLDARAEYDLFCRFRALARGRTTLLISHRFSTLSMADRLLVIDNGRIVESGTHDELLEQQGLYANLYYLHRQQMMAPASA